MNIIKEWYLDGLYLLDDLYGEIMLVVSLAMASLLTIWRFYPLDLRLWATIWVIVLFYILLSGMLMELYIIILAEPAVQALALLIGFIIIGTNYSMLQLSQAAIIGITITIVILIYKALFDCYFSSKLSQEDIRFIEIIRITYSWIVYAIPCALSIIFSAPLSVTLMMLVYVICIPIICEIVDILGLFDGV